MKKGFLIIVAVLFLVLTACSQNAAPASQNSPASSSDNQQTAAPAETQAAPQEKPKTDYPKKPIELLVPTTAGGPTDYAARVLAKKLPEYLPNNPTIAVVNKPGAGGTIGATEIFNSAPDGYKLGVLTHNAISLQPLYGETVYDVDSFQPIGRITGSQQVFFVKADSPWKTFEDWLEYVKNNPGQFNYGPAAGIGSGAHLPMVMLENAAGIQLKVVSFAGTPELLNAVVGGHVMGGVAQAGDVKPLAEEGMLRPLFNIGDKEIHFMKDVPSLKEKGFDIVVNSDTSLFAPKGTPPEIVEIVSEALKKAMEDPEVKEEFAKVNLEPGYATGEEVQQSLNDANSRYDAVMKELKLGKYK